VDPVSPLINLTSSEGVITVIAFFGGIVLFLVVGLGGVGARDLAKPYGIILGILSVALIIGGGYGMWLVAYPAISPGLEKIQEGFPSPIPTVVSEQGLTPSPATSLAQRYDTLVAIFGLIMLLVLVGLIQLIPPYVKNFYEEIKRKR